MADRATSDHPLVQLQLNRLAEMTGGRDRLGRSRLRRLLEELGNPERRLPPVIHVAGTNGKGSVIAYLRAIFAATGMAAHVYTSPHLVRLNERIRIANCLVDDDTLAGLLGEVLDAVADDETTFFEATTAAAFLAFSRTPADVCIIEVGIGGRLDATNVVSDAIACAIAQIGIDHQDFLGDTIEEIAAEKAGIAKPGVPLIVQTYPKSVSAQITAVAKAANAPLVRQGADWDAWIENGKLRYRDAQGTLDLPLPALAGAHQAGNAGVAVAIIRHQRRFAVREAEIGQGLVSARWPARLASLAQGPVRSILPEGATLLLDGAHNVAAMRMVVAHLEQALAKGERLEMVLGLLKDKDAPGVLGCFTRLNCRIRTVPITGYDCRDPAELAAIAASLGLDAVSEQSFAGALAAIARDHSSDRPLSVLITGSLYLAGEVLKMNREVPD